MTKNKALPFASSLWRELAETYKTPLYIYDEKGIREHARKLKSAFSWAKNYINYFAVKATPTPAILRLLAEEGMGFDCSSKTELELIKRDRLEQKGIFYTSNNTSDEDYDYAASLGAIINLDKSAYLQQALKAFENNIPQAMAIRLNPGSRLIGNSIMGDPLEAKFGDKQENILKALSQMKDFGIERLGLHTMPISNERNPLVFTQIAKIMKELIDLLNSRLDIKVDFVNLGGGFGINYHPEEKEIDIDAIGQAIKNVFQDSDINICTESGRYLTGPHGYLLTSVSRGLVESYQTFLNVDTSVNNLNRLITVEGAYHHLSPIAPRGKTMKKMTVVGSLCADVDRMFKDCSLPADIRTGDLLVIHDAGAHARADATNYNGLPRCAEVLVREDNSHCLIRRHETIDDILATVNNL